MSTAGFVTPADGIDPDAEGARRGGYRLLERIGAGGMGVVHLAVDRRGRAVAVKMLRDHVAGDDSARERLAREFDSLSRVVHPAVAGLVDADLSGERPYLVTRYVPGRPLDEWVADHGPLVGPDLLRFAQTLASALDAIHAADVVHRDLKPSNVLMSDGSPVVIDFGIAHIADESRLTRTGLVMGTPGFLAPELLDEAAVGEATDWWAWAATLAYAATGRLPFGRGPIDAVFLRVHRGEADLRGVEPGLADLLRRLLDPRPGHRPDRSRIREALEVLARGGDVTTVLGPSLAAGSGTSTQAFSPDTTRVAPDETTRVSPPQHSARPWTPAVHAPDRRPDRQGGTSEAPTAATPVVGTAAMPAVDPAMGRPTWSYAGFRSDRASGHPAPGGGPLPPGASRGPGAVRPPVGPTGASAWAPEAGQRPGWPAIRRARSRPVVLAGGLLLAAGAAGFPLVAFFAALVWAVLARTVDASVTAVSLRRYVRGQAHASDVVRAVVASPVRLVGACVVTALIALLHVAIIVPALFATGAAVDLGAGRGAGATDPFGELPLAVAASIGWLFAWWGPGGHALRNGSSTIVTTLTPGRWTVRVVALVLFLAAAYFALRTQGSGVSPNWIPLPDGPDQLWGLPW